MKFHWGIGITVFLGVFLLLAAIFIVFAFRQEVSLVHEDYYERGVDYENQMEVDARSAKYQDIIQSQLQNDALVIGFSEMPGARIDSGNLKLFRPSDQEYDVEVKIGKEELSWAFPRENLIKGRYILDLIWYAEGLRYEVRKPVIVSRQ